MNDDTADDLLANYKRAYDNRIGFGRRPALILVDFVRAYFDERCELFEIGRASCRERVYTKV